MDSTLFSIAGLYGLALLGLNFFLLCQTSRLLLRPVFPAPAPLLIYWQAMALAALGQIVFICLLAGYGGFLHAGSVTLLQTVFYFIVRAGARRKGYDFTGRELWFFLRRDLIRAPSRFLGAFFRDRRRGFLEKACLAGLLAALGLFLAAAILTAPLNVDANNYRLPRAAYWLQEHSIRHFPVTDERLNYVGVNTCLVMSWLTGFFPAGYPLVKLPQFAGGLLCIMAVYELARQAGFGPRARLAAVLLLFSMAHWTYQMTACQTDLFTAGCLNSGILFLFLGFATGRFAYTLIAWLGVSLAIGAKATVLLWVFGLAGLYLAWLFQHPAQARTLWRTAAAAIPLLCVLALPRYAENTLAYGQPMAPREEMEKLRPVPGRTWMDKTRANGMAYFTQLFAPVSNPLLPASGLRAIHEKLEPFLARGLDAEEAGERKAHLRKQFAAGNPGSTDTASAGLLASALFLIGGTSAASVFLKGKNPGAGLVLLFFAAVLLFWAAFLAGPQWSPYKHRFTVLAAPLTALTAAFPAVLLKARWRNSFLVMVLMAGAATTRQAICNNPESGLSVLPHSEGCLSTEISIAGYGAVLRSILEPGGRLALALPPDYLLSPFFRNGLNTRARFVPMRELEKYSRPADFLRASGEDWLFTHPLVFENRHGHIHTEVFLDRGSKGRYAFAAYRLLAPEEQPNAFVDAVQTRDYPGGRARRYAFSIQNNFSGQARFRIHNGSGSEITAEAWSGAGRGNWRIRPGAQIEAPLRAGIHDIAYIRVQIPEAKWREAFRHISITPILTP